MTGREAAAVLRSLAERVEKLSDEYYVGPPSACIVTDNKAEMVECRNTIGGKWEKKADSGVIFRLVQDHLTISVMRDKVCERIVETVTVPARPEVTYAATPERVEERVTWRCPESLLAETE